MSSKPQIREKGPADARSMAARMLSYRPLSESALKKKLMQKGVSLEDAEDAAARMRELSALDDEACARSIVRHYSSRGYGPIHIRHELTERGIDPELSELVLSAPGLDEVFEDALLALLRKKLGDKPRENLPRAARAAQARGFLWDSISSAISRLTGEYDG